MTFNRGGPQNRRWPTGLAASAGLALIAAYGWRSVPPELASRYEGTISTASSSERSGTMGETPGLRSLSTTRDPTPEGDPQRPINHRLRGADTANLVKNFDLATVYPPSVRLLMAYQTEFTQPDRYEGEFTVLPLPELVLSPVEQEQATASARAGENMMVIRQRLLAERGFDGWPRYRLSTSDNDVGPGEALSLDLELTLGQRPLAHRVIEAHVRSTHPESVALARVTPTSSSGGRTKIEFVATSEDESLWGDLQLELTISVGGRLAHITHRFYSTPFRIAEFGPQMRETLQDGSLALTTRVTMRRLGECSFSALLYDAQGEPIARATHHDVLRPGDHPINFVFYGKVFHDARFRGGKVMLRQMRGDCVEPSVPPEWANRPRDYYAQRKERNGSRALPPEPRRAALPTVELAYVTKRSYRLSDFTDSVWDSEPKRRQRALLARLQASREAHRFESLRTALHRAQ